jgi:hypothetical protein
MAANHLISARLYERAIYTQVQSTGSRATLPYVFIFWLGVLSLISLFPGESLACGWHYETIRAEAKSLPCTRNVVSNAWPAYPKTLLQMKAKIARATLILLPTSLRALDELAVSSILLKDLPAAHCALMRRKELAPDAYATHANLGTYYTFSGELEKATQHVKATLAEDPQAHFGRELDHLKLIEYLQTQTGEDAFKTDLYGRSYKTYLKSKHRRGKETRATLQAQEAALVSMISIYGASKNPHLFATLAVTLKEQGNILLSAAAARQADILRHPQRRIMRRWVNKLDKIYKPKLGRRSPKREHGVHAGIAKSLQKAETAASYRAGKYQKWLRKRFKAGMPFWRNEGVNEIYDEQLKRKLRCPLPKEMQSDMKPPAYPSHQELIMAQGAALVTLAERIAGQKKKRVLCKDLAFALKEWNPIKRETGEEHQSAEHAKTSNTPTSNSGSGDEAERYITRCSSFS